MSTFRAVLRGVCRVHSDHFASGAFSLLREDTAKHTPTGIGNGFVQTCLGRMTVGQILSCRFVLSGFRTSGHVPDVQLLDSNLPETLDQLTSGLVNEVMTTVADAL